jgi:hypothetical protein
MIQETPLASDGRCLYVIGMHFIPEELEKAQEESKN